MHTKYATSVKAIATSKKIRFAIQDAIDHKLRQSLPDMTTITDVRMSGDLQITYVFFTTLTRNSGEDEYILATLKDLKPYFRKIIAKTTNLRLTPDIRFIADTLLSDATEIEAKIEAAKKSDAELEKLRQSAQLQNSENPENE